MLSIAFLIPVKVETLLDFNSKIYILINNLYKNINIKYKYNFYLGFDYNDKCLKNKSIFDKFKSNNFSINIVEFNNSIKSGHLTKMWNELFIYSYKTNDYFYQLGDDIIFNDYNFIDKYISVLNDMNDIGVTGLRTTKGNTSIITQSFVSKKHYEIFGYYFPETIINFFCDDWISYVYKKHNLYKPLEKVLINSITSRYNAIHSKDMYKIELKKGIKTLKEYLNYKFQCNLCDFACNKKHYFDNHIKNHHLKNI